LFLSIIELEEKNRDHVVNDMHVIPRKKGDFAGDVSNMERTALPVESFGFGIKI
jgi:hypothetical protein